MSKSLREEIQKLIWNYSHETDNSKWIDNVDTLDAILKAVREAMPKHKELKGWGGIGTPPKEYSETIGYGKAIGEMFKVLDS